MLYVQSPHVAEISGLLRASRDGYAGEVHFREIRGASGQSQQYQVARRWVRLFFDELIDHVAFKATVALHDGPVSVPYPDEPVAYARHLIHSTRHVFVGLTRFALTGFDEVTVHPVFDATGNNITRHLYARAVEQFVHRANTRRERGDRRYPFVIDQPLHFVSSDPLLVAPTDRDDCELIQLTDVLLGAAMTALDFKQSTKYSGRLQLASDLASQMAKHWGGNSLTYSRRARNFTVTLWPDKFGFSYPALPVREPGSSVPRKLPGSERWHLGAGMALWR